MDVLAAQLDGFGAVIRKRVSVAMGCVAQLPSRELAA
jgi:hypothetical protein